MKKYYLGGYYLTLLSPFSFEQVGNEHIYTCSECINTHLVDTWAYGWNPDNDQEALFAKEKFQFSDNQIDLIREWVNKKHHENKLGWTNVFTDVETVLEFKNTFCAHLSDVKVLAIYFEETELNHLVEKMKPQSPWFHTTGLYMTLSKKVEENDKERFLGFDYVGMEGSGSFHTFHCHGLDQELSNTIGLTLNEYGLFDSDLNSTQVLAYLNDKNSPCEPVPWLIAKTKMVENS